MARASARAALRKLRQHRNEAALSAQWKQQYPLESQQYIIFGGPRGKSKGRDADTFL